MTERFWIEADFICIPIDLLVSYQNTKSRQYNTLKSYKLASFGGPFKRKGNSVVTEETINYLYKTNTQSV